MALCRIYEWQREKTVKLSDTYDVEIRIENDSGLRSNYVKLPECTSVTLPEYKYREEVYRYGNNAKKFLIPDYSGLEDVSIELIEHYKDDFEDFAHLRVQDIVNVCLNKLFDSKTFTYRTDDYIDELRITVYKNNFSRSIIRYVFESLKLTDYTKYDLDYNSTELAKWTLKFSYQSYYVEDIVADEEAKIRAEEERKRQAEWEERYRQQTAARDAETRNRAGRYGRGMPTPKEDQANAKKRQENIAAELESKQAEYEKKYDELEALQKKTADKEQKNLQDANAEVAALEQKLEQAKQVKEQRAKEHQEQAEKHSKAVKENAEYTAHTTDRQRKRKGELWDAEKLAEENRKITSDALKKAEAEVAAIEKELAAAKSKAEAADSKFKNKTNSIAKREKLRDELASLEAEIRDIRKTTETVAGQVESFQGERQKYEELSSEDKLRYARYKDSAEHAERARAAESKEDKMRVSDLKNAYDLAHMDKWESDAVTRAQENYDRAVEAEAEHAKRIAETTSKWAGSALDDVSEMMQAEENLKASRAETQYNMEKAKWGDAQQDMGKSVRNEQAGIASTMNKRTLEETLDPSGLTNRDNPIGYIPDTEDVLSLNELEDLDDGPITVPFIGATAVRGQDAKTDQKTLLDIPSTVYSSEKFNNRVTELLSSELYSNMNDKQLAYDRAQKQALEEYMRGELGSDNK